MARAWLSFHQYFKHSVQVLGFFTLGVLPWTFLVSGCTPSVKVLTPDPLKVDMTVRLDIYQEEAPKEKGTELNIEVAANRRQRLADILDLKAKHVAGEDRDGFLALSPQPPKDPAELTQAKKLIDAENTDRSVIYLNNSQSEGRPLDLVEQDYSKLWRDRALPGEWVQQNDGQWKQK
jgi:uncharacterized protein YdbL (DUF1318 family)